MEPERVDPTSDTERRVADLAEIVSGNARAHNNLAAAHNKLVDEGLRKEQEAVLAKRLENLSKIVSVTYEKAAAYTNVILIAGYASFFAMWLSTRPALSSRIAIAAVLLMTISATAFIAFETYKMIGNALFFRRSQGFLTDPTVLQSPEIFQQRLDEYETQNRRYALSFIRVWVVVLALAVPTAVLAVGLLAYNYLLLLLRPGQAATGMGVFL